MTDTVRKGIVDVEIYSVYSMYDNSTSSYILVSNCTDITDPAVCQEYTAAEFLLGELGALTGTAVWLVGASLFKMPVSATQSVVGAIVGFSLVLRGSNGIHWSEMIRIGNKYSIVLVVVLGYSSNITSILFTVISWVASPLMAGIISSLFYLIIKVLVFMSDDQLKASLAVLPFFFWFTLVVNLFTVFYEGSRCRQFISTTNHLM